MISHKASTDVRLETLAGEASVVGVLSHGVEDAMLVGDESGERPGGHMPAQEVCDEYD